MRVIKRYVIAGNHDEFKYWCQYYGWTYKDTAYLWSYEQLRGLHDVTIERVGQWTKSPLAFDPYLALVEKI